jgi:RPA family protein
MRVFYEKYYNNKDTNIKTSLKEERVQDVNKKIMELFNRNGYIFNLDVIIKTVNETMETKIAGKIKNYLITLDNKVIPISEIIEINEKN